MNEKQKSELLEILKKNLANDDPSHDINHVLRVLKLSEQIGKKEGADMEIVIPMALFHDLVTYPKDDELNKNATEESAIKAEQILSNLNWYPKEKIDDVTKGIKVISFSKGITAKTLESKTVQDADMLEATGAISIMRTFASSGKMNRLFYNPNDPFAQNRELNDLKYSVDLFYTRLLKVEEKINTRTAEKIAKRRVVFLRKFLEELRSELEGK